MVNTDIILDFSTFALFLGILTIAAYALGRYMASVFAGERTLLSPLFEPLERKIYRLAGTSPDGESDWKGYAKSMVMFNGIGLVFLFLLLLVQGWLFLNPQGITGFPLEIALNAAVSFVTNTNWQTYSGEVSASYLTQMAGFTVQNFLSAATGICIAIALMRGITRRETGSIGNFWADMTRAILYILLPLSFILALFLVSQGVIQNLNPYAGVSELDPSSGTQLIAMGPVASQEAIKELGTNGGGFFNANSAHPFENPSPLTNIVEIFSLLLISAAFPFTFGRMTGDGRQGWVLYFVMLITFSGAFVAIYSFEQAGNPSIDRLGVYGPPMEGKEVRFGLAPSVLFAVATTATSCGAVNTMHDSLTPMAGMIPLYLILLGEIIFGGVGSGFYTMIAFVIIAVFIAALMIGKMPEYLGKKIEALEMRLSLAIVLTSNVLILILTAIALMIPQGLNAILNPGPHGLTEVVYAFASMSNNNGSAFAGLNAAALFYVLAGAFAMLIGRFVPAVAVLAIAGSLGQKKAAPASPGTLPTHSLIFILWLIAVITVVGALTFFPLIAAGPIAEHLLMTGGG